MTAALPWNQVTLIGVGLIGGSLGLALKENALVRQVVGVSRTQATLDAALSCGVIDTAHTNLADAVAQADMVVLCTPLSTYGSLTSQLVPHLKKGAILTDVGSVKTRPTRDVLAALSEAQRPFFVPGHPIAGTEHSGPEAAFATLYKHKKVIVTPTEFTDANAVAQVTAMWQAVGAEVEQLDAARHDVIYAISSHLVQLLSSLFMNQVATQQDIQPLVDEWFCQFIRLAGSDATMWRDIFVSNHDALAEAVDVFATALDGLIQQLERGNWQAIQDRVSLAAEKRRHFYGLLKKRLPDAPALKKREVRYEDGNVAIWMGYVPRLLACALIEQVPEADYDYATGSGLHGFTQPLLYVGATQTTGLERHAEAVAGILQQLNARLRACVDSDTTSMLTAAKKAYQQWID